MDFALFSPSSLFDDNEGSSFSLSLGVYTVYMYMKNLYTVLFADEETAKTHESYVERSHQFPGMVSAVGFFKSTHLVSFPILDRLLFALYLE